MVLLLLLWQSWKRKALHFGDFSNCTTTVFVQKQSASTIMITATIDYMKSVILHSCWLPCGEG